MLSLEEKIKNAQRNMIFFRGDKNLHTFWKNVYYHYRDLARAKK